MIYQEVTKAAHDLSLWQMQGLNQIVLDFWTNNSIKKYVMINFTLPVSIDFANLLKSVNQGGTNTMTQYIMHIANHLSAVLF